VTYQENLTPGEGRR